MGCYEIYDQFMQALVMIRLPIFNYKSCICVSITALVIYNSLTLHRDVFVNEIARYVYCSGPNEKFRPLAETIHKYFRYTSKIYYEFTNVDGRVVLNPVIPLLEEFCSDENMRWNILKMVRAFFGFFFIGICYVGMRLEYESVFPLFMFYEIATFLVDWYYWIEDLALFLGPSAIATNILFMLYILAPFGFFYTMWNLLNELSDLLSLRHNPPPKPDVNLQLALLKGPEIVRRCKYCGRRGEAAREEAKQEEAGIEMVPLMRAEPGQAEQGEAGLEMVPLMRPESRQAEQEGAKSVVTEVHV